MTAARTAAAERWARAHRAVERELTGVELEVIRGEIPSELRGSLYRVGPGRLEAHGARYGHLFDGDGHACRFEFGDGAARFTNRYVRTREFEREREAGQLLYRSFGTPKPGGVRANAFDPVFKNAANTTAFVHEDRLYALWEAGLPHRLATDDLATLAREDFDGALLAPDNPWTRIAGRDRPFSAHPRVDPTSGELFNFGLANGPAQKLVLYRGTREGAMTSVDEHTLDALYFVHDFSLTTRFRVLLLSPARFGVVRTMLGVDTPVSGMRFDPRRPTKIWLAPRDGSPPIVLDGPPGFVFHHVNAFEDDRGFLRVHALRSDALPALPLPDDLRANSAAPPASELSYYSEFVIDPLRKTARCHRLFDTPCELPFVSPSLVSSRHRFAWATATDQREPCRVFTRVVKFDLRERRSIERDLGPGFPGEPVFVPRGDGGRGDDGWLLAMGFDHARGESALEVMDARTLETAATLALPITVPPGFHGAFRAQ